MMTDYLAVKIGQTAENLRDINSHERLAERAEFAQYVTQRSVLDIFQHNVKVVGSADGVDVLDDVGVLQSLHQLDFCLY